MRFLALLAAALAVGPAPIRGEPAGRAGLRLLVADAPPFILDVDRGSVRRLALEGTEVGPVSVVRMGGRGGVVGVGDRFWGVGPAGRAVRLPRADRVVAADAASVWIQTRTGRACTLRRTSLAGRALRAPRRFPCTTWSDPPGGSLGVVVNRTRIVDPATGRTVFRTRGGILAVAGRNVLVARGGALVLLDARSGVERVLGWPSSIAFTSQSGLDEQVVDRSGRYVAIGFGDPAVGPSSQVLDLWVLDMTTRVLVHVPSMPAEVALKRTNFDWSADGRLVLLGESGRRKVVATWRPGETTLRVKTVRLPERDGGSDTFAVLPLTAR